MNDFGIVEFLLSCLANVICQTMPDRFYLLTVVTNC